jgi:uncharacterized protein (TIGR02246 family)
MSQGSSRLVLLLALLASACSDSSTPTALPSADATTVLEAKLGTNPPGQVQHIEALVGAVEAAWAAADATAYAASYSEDVQFIGPTGGVISGRAMLRNAHVGAFNNYFPASTLQAQIRRIEFLTGTIAMVDLNYRVSGCIALPPGLRATELGVIRHAVRWVVVKNHGEWEIHGQQMTPVPPVGPNPGC